MIRALLSWVLRLANARTVRSSHENQFQNSRRGNFAARFYSGSTMR
jgi:hypothetical protein